MNSANAYDNHIPIPIFDTRLEKSLARLPSSITGMKHEGIESPCNARRTRVNRRSVKLSPIYLPDALTH